MNRVDPSDVGSPTLACARGATPTMDPAAYDVVRRRRPQPLDAAWRRSPAGNPLSTQDPHSG
jgi:hypothetical protein